MGHSIESLMKDLRGMGISAGDTLLVHTSLRKVGETENRANGVIEALTRVLGDDGLLVLPTLTYECSAAGDPLYDYRTTPALTGVLPNVFLTYPGVVRSLHPTHSVAAWGKDAEEFIKGHENFDTPCAKGSPWGKLAERNAKILFIGCTLRSNTFLHAVEEWHDYIGITPEAEMLYTIMPDGTRKEVPSRRHTGNHNAWYEKIRPHLEAGNALTCGKFGNAECLLLDAVLTGEIAWKCLDSDPAYFTF